MSCIQKKCKSELASLESDKVFKALKDDIAKTGKEMASIAMKEKTTKKDVDRVKVLQKLMRKHIDDKNAIEKFNKLRMCTLKKCTDDIENMLKIVRDDCKLKKPEFAKKVCALAKHDQNVQKVTDSLQDQVFSDLIKRVKQKSI